MKKTTYLNNKVVLITGGSSGLGLVLAEHLIGKGCKLAICARSEEELARAQAHLEKLGGEVLVKRCDVGNAADVEALIKRVLDHYGALDVLINNAGIIQVGPMETFSLKQYKEAMDVMFWGMANTTMTVLPYMKQRKQGHIVNITSVGGKVPVPHLLPYDAAKFAAVGFSEGSSAELRKDNIRVTTILPWLMRTGSYVNAFFQKGNKQEFKLFSFMSSAPLLTLNVNRAASKIIDAIEARKSYKVIGIQAKLAIQFHNFFPNLTSRLFGAVAALIPASDERAELEAGAAITERSSDAEVPVIKQIGKRAREEHQELRP